MTTAMLKCDTLSVAVVQTEIVCRAHLFMNNNTKRNRARLATLSKGQVLELNIPSKRTGNHGPEYEHRTQWIPYGHQPRKSTRPKVGGRNGR